MASSFSLRCICSSRASISLLSSISAPSLSLLPSPLLFAPAPRRFFAPSEGPTHTARPKCPKTPRRAKPCQLKAWEAWEGRRVCLWRGPTWLGWRRPARPKDRKNEVFEGVYISTERRKEPLLALLSLVPRWEACQSCRRSSTTRLKTTESTRRWTVRRRGLLLSVSITIRSRTWSRWLT